MLTHLYSQTNWLVRATRLILAVVAIHLFLGTVETARAVTSCPCTLAWNASTGPVAGYRVYYTASGSSTTNRVDVGGALTGTLRNLIAGTNYMFYVSAYDSAGHESAPSNAINYRPPAIARLQASNLGAAGIRIQFLVATNASCHVEYTASLKPPVWKPLIDAIADANGNVSVTDPLSGKPAMRFYRAVEP